MSIFTGFCAIFAIFTQKQVISAFLLFDSAIPQQNTLQSRHIFYILFVLFEIARTRPDLIKLMVTGGVLDASESGEPGVLKMPPESKDKQVCLGERLALQIVVFHTFQNFLKTFQRFRFTHSISSVFGVMISIL